MATNREDLEIEKIRTEISKMMAETAKINKLLDTEISKMMAEIAKISKSLDTEISKTIDESSKIRAETLKINSENTYYPLLIGSGITIAIGTFIGALIKLLLL